MRIKRGLFAIAVAIATVVPADAQFFDKMERALDKLTGNTESSESVKSVSMEGRPYGMNPGLNVMLSGAEADKEKLVLTLTFEPVGDRSVTGLNLSAGNIRLGVPEFNDSTVIFVVSEPYAPMGKPVSDPAGQELLKVGVPSVTLDIQSGKMVDVALVWYGFPKKVKKIERLDLGLSQVDVAGKPTRYFGFTFDNIGISR